MSGYIGVDLDATLALYKGWVADDFIGEPVPLMLTRVKKWLSEGKEVRIITARVARDNPKFHIAWKRWSMLHIGKVLEVQCHKCMGMVQLWDDRAVQVEPNTGRRIDGKE